MGIFIILLFIPGAMCLTGFDCDGSQGGNHYSTDPPVNCRSFRLPPIKNRGWIGTVLQEPLSISRKFKSCQVLSQTTSVYCTWSKNTIHLDKKTDDFSLIPEEISTDRCDRAWKTGYLDFPLGEIKVVPGQVIKEVVGDWVNGEGKCVNSYEYFNITKIQVALLEVEATEYSTPSGIGARLFLENSELVPDGNGRGFHSTDGIRVLGTENTFSLCSWEELYKGKGSLLQTNSTAEYVVIEELGVGFEIVGNMTVCGLSVLTTKDPSIYLIESTHINVKKASSGFRGRLSSLITSGLTGLELITQLRNLDSQSSLLERDCILEQNFREQLYQSAKLDPDQAARTLTGRLGWTMIVAGRSLILKQCTEVAVILDPRAVCFSDIPIKGLNDSHYVFMDPITFVLKTTSHQIDCRDDSVPVFQIRNRNYRLSPGIVEVPHLDGLPSGLVTYLPTLKDPGSGLYSHEVTASMDQPLDHSSLQQEVNTQLLKLGSGKFHPEQDRTGVLSNLAAAITRDLPPRWCVYTIASVTLISSILSALNLYAMWKTGAWTVFCNRELQARYQIQLLSNLIHSNSPV